MNKLEIELSDEERMLLFYCLGIATAAVDESELKKRIFKLTQRFANTMQPYRG